MCRLVCTFVCTQTLKTARFFLLRGPFSFLFVSESKDKRCFTPIHCASLTGNAECISTLLDGGSEVNSRGFAGATPLHITVSSYCEIFLFNLHLGDSHIQNFHLGRYIVGYTVGNLVLRQRASGAVKRDFRTYIR